MKIKVYTNSQETIVGIKTQQGLFGSKGNISNQIEILSRPGYHNVEDYLVEKLLELVDNSELYYQLIK